MKIRIIVPLLISVSLLASTLAHAQGKWKKAVLTVQANRQFAENVLDRNARKIWFEDLNQFPDVYCFDMLEVTKLIPDLQGEVVSYLSDPGKRCITTRNPIPRRGAKAIFRFHQLEKINGLLPDFIELPDVTQADVNQLAEARVRTSITLPMPRFKAANVKNSIGLYYTTMGAYPDLSQVPWMTQALSEELYAFWKDNPDLPLTFTTSDEDVLFAKRLSELTGRKFTILSDAQNEYMRRGRTEDTADSSRGAITTTDYYFGNDSSLLREIAFVAGNLLTQGRVHEVHEIPEQAQAGAYKTPRGFVHVIGIAYERDPKGILRGASFYSNSGESSQFFTGARLQRDAGIGSRLAEVY